MWPDPTIGFDPRRSGLLNRNAPRTGARKLLPVGAGSHHLSNSPASSGQEASRTTMRRNLILGVTFLAAIAGVSLLAGLQGPGSGPATTGCRQGAACAG